MIKNNCPPPELNKRPIGPVSGALVLACLIFPGRPSDPTRFGCGHGAPGNEEWKAGESEADSAVLLQHS